MCHQKFSVNNPHSPSVGVYSSSKTTKESNGLNHEASTHSFSIYFVNHSFYLFWQIVLGFLLCKYILSFFGFYLFFFHTIFPNQRLFSPLLPVFPNTSSLSVPLLLISSQKTGDLPVISTKQT